MPKLIEITVNRLMNSLGDAGRATVRIVQGDWVQVEDFHGKTNDSYRRELITPNDSDPITAELIFCDSPTTNVVVYAGDTQIPVKQTHPVAQVHNALDDVRRMHREYIRNVDAHIIDFNAPCCGAALETPAIDGDTLAICTNCGKTYYRIVEGNQVTAVKL